MKRAFDEMVDEVFNWIEGEPQENIDQFLGVKEENLFMYHDTLGRTIRNHFRLWEHPWTPIFQVVDGIKIDVSNEHPDAISMRVIEEVWKRAMESYRCSSAN
jgi:hypothetical protein